MNHHRPARLRVALGALLCLSPLLEEAKADTLSFSAVRASSLPLAEYLSESYTYTRSEQRSDAAIASATIPTGTARSQSFLGTNRVAVESLAPVDDEFLRQNSIGGPFSVAISAWSDRFTITGGIGIGTAMVSASVSGQFGPKPDPSYGGSGAYYLFVVDSTQLASLFAKPFEFMVNTDLSRTNLRLVQNVLRPGDSDPGESVAPGSTFGRNLLGSVDFTYGAPFYLVSILAGYANDYGILNSFNSANFGITGPLASSISTESGFEYATAVPEPNPWLLFSFGLTVVLCWRRLRSQTQTGA